MAGEGKSVAAGGEARSKKVVVEEKGKMAALSTREAIWRTVLRFKALCVTYAPVSYVVEEFCTVYVMRKSPGCSLSPSVEWVRYVDH